MSLSLLASIADLIGIGRRQAFVLDRPGDRSILASNRAKPQDTWRRFTNDRALLARYRITPRELRLLKRISRLGRVRNPRYFLAILNSIRQAMEEE